MYFDSAYIAKYYINEADSPAVRQLIRKARRPSSSVWALNEVMCVFHRHMCLGVLTVAQRDRAAAAFLEHVKRGLWRLVPVSKDVLSHTVELVRHLPGSVPLRAGDALHIATALHLREPAIWTSDRHLLAAARHCGLEGRTA